jgi:holo-[acyl-carrier protein] synthase
MIIGIGMDLVEVRRVERLLERHPDRALRRLFTASEVDYCNGKGLPAQSFAARFAAKEALFKALGTGLSGGMAWHEVEVVSDPAGAPGIVLHGRAAAVANELRVKRIHLALTHTTEVAGASVILEGASD